MTATPNKWTTQEMPMQTGKTVLITGANSGIGYQAALAFAQKGAHVLLGCRNATKGQEALAKIQSAVPQGEIELELLDVASLASVRAFAERFGRRNSALDILVNNAGVMAIPERQVTEDGFERQFGTNHLGHFALTGLLLPALVAARTARVVTVASLAHRNGKIDWNNLQGQAKYDPWGAYQASKLANILFAREFARRAAKASVPVLSVAVHPGVSRTNIFENGPGSGDLKARILKLFAPLLTHDDVQGAFPITFAATMPQITAGAYFGPDGFGELKGFPKEVAPRANALDPQVGARLWQASEELTGVSYLD